MRSTSAEVHVDIMVPCDKAFSHIVPIDLTNIFTGFQPLPAVKGMRNQTGTWDAASQSRTVLLSDGSSAQEALTAYRFPSHFAYRLEPFVFLITQRLWRGHMAKTLRLSKAQVEACAV